VKRSADDSWRALQGWARESVDVEISLEQWSRLRTYVDELRLWNRRMSLVSQQDLAAILTKHVADSLVAASHCGAARRIADLGSGAGFPGIPIAILQPRAAVWLMESTAKKVSFLETARRVVGLSNLFTFEGRIEAAAQLPIHQRAYDLVTSRALAEIEKMRHLAQPLLVPGGRLLAMRSDSVNQVETAEVIRYELPDRAPRLLQIIPAEPDIA